MGWGLTLERVTWAFPGASQPFLVVDDLRVAPGQFVAVTGPSGAGKSTFLHLLAGLEAPNSGRLLWGDQPPRDGAWRRRNVGLVFQDFQLVPELSAVENVLLPLTFERWSVSADQRREAAEALQRLGVDRVQARASQLSRGEMQRTALARALFSRPPVVLADEPTASLDQLNEDSVSHLLAVYCRQEGATLVVATHQTRLRDRADRIVTLDHGHVSEAK